MRGAITFATLVLVCLPFESARAEETRTGRADAIEPSGASSASARSASSSEPTVDAPLFGGDESPELRALRLAEQALFARSTTSARTTPPFVRFGRGEEPRWLDGLSIPDLQVRWDARVVQFLEFYKNDARGRELMTGWLRRRGRYATYLRRRLRTFSVPEDLAYVAMVESGYDPSARSSAGAVGLWQMVGGTAAEYGLSQTHWVDERMDPYASTDAAAKYLRDLHARFGSWELALAAYNMGYGALLRAIRKYNTNDYYELANTEAGLPFETTIYVAKIIATAIVGRNPRRFGFGQVVAEQLPASTTVDVPGGFSLAGLAAAAEMDGALLAALNPELRCARTPPGEATWPLRVPERESAKLARAVRKLRRGTPRYRAYEVRFGERIDDIAERYQTTPRTLDALNRLEGETQLPVGFTMLVPNVVARTDLVRERPVVTVPPTSFRYRDRRRVFYRARSGDTAEDIARFFSVSMNDLCRWNALEPEATLHSGMFLQVFVARDVDLRRAVVLYPADVRILVAHSDEFFDYHESQRGRRRFRYEIEEGDSVASVAARFGLAPADVARINRIAENAALEPGQRIIVYTAPETPPTL